MSPSIIGIVIVASGRRDRVVAGSHSMRRDFLSHKVLFDKKESQVIMLAVEVSDLEWFDIPVAAL